MISTHTPFSNDSETKIKSYVLPLKDGWHLRVHKVSLSQPYFVYEGGFSVGIRDDGFIVDQNSIAYGQVQSQIIVKSNLPTSYDIHRIHPGMHLLQPQALYPVYKTECLEKGEYIFATLVCFTTNGKKQNPPKVAVSDNKITVTYGEFEKTIKID